MVEPRGRVLYDAGCGVCARGVARLAPTLTRLGLSIAPLQQRGVASRLGRAPDAPRGDLQLLLDDGRRYGGADVYRYIVGRLWWASPLHALASAPGGRRVFDAAYRAFADRRHLLFHTCGGQAGARPPFVTAAWQHLLMLNYDVKPALLEPLVPAGTVLDLWRGRAIVSVVAVRVLDTRVYGAAIPRHRDFDAISCRFYVRRDVDGEVRRGAVVVRALVSRTAVALLARRAYHAPSLALPMRHLLPPAPTVAPGRIAYEWRTAAGWQRIEGTAIGEPSLAEADSEAAFVTERAWGYGHDRDGATLEYEVAHTPWRVWAAHVPALVADIAALYGPQFVRTLEDRPTSAFIADGSRVAVYPPRRLVAPVPAPVPARG